MKISPVNYDVAVSKKITKETFEVELGIIQCSSHTIPQQVEEIRQLLYDKFLFPRTILTVNAHIYNLAYKNTELLKILNSCRMVTADGMAIVWASELFGKKIPERCNATEAFREFLKDKTMPVNHGILIGCSEEEAEQAAKNIEKTSNHCKIRNTYSGFLSMKKYKQIFIANNDVDFIFIGMGTPKTEQMSKIAEIICPQAIVWGIGGGTIRIFANTMKEAPVIWRKVGLQWLYRLLSDPIKLWKRYVIGNPLFIYRVFKESKKYRPKNTNP